MAIETPSAPHCGNCRYYASESGEGECRRYAPGWGGRRHLRVFPIVQIDDWCGMHGPKLEGERE